MRDKDMTWVEACPGVQAWKGEVWLEKRLYRYSTNSPIAANMKVLLPVREHVFVIDSRSRLVALVPVPAKKLQVEDVNSTHVGKQRGTRSVKGSSSCSISPWTGPCRQ